MRFELRHSVQFNCHVANAVFLLSKIPEEIRGYVEGFHSLSCCALDPFESVFLFQALNAESETGYKTKLTVTALARALKMATSVASLAVL